MMSVNWKANTGLLGIAAFVGLSIFVGLSMLQLYVVEILLTATIFVLLVIRGGYPSEGYFLLLFFSRGNSRSQVALEA